MSPLLPALVEDEPPPAAMMHRGWGIRVTAELGANYLTFEAGLPRSDELVQYDNLGNAYLELLCPGPVGKLFADVAPGPGQDVVIRAYTSGSCRASVVERSDDLLTKGDYTKYARVSV